jgi:hypothetical protein
MEAFCEKVRVIDADWGGRARRLNLVARFPDAVHPYGDFSRIEG